MGVRRVTGARRRALSVVLAVGLLAAGCIGRGGPQQVPIEPSPAEPPVADTSDLRAGGTLRLGLSADPVSIDPRFVVDDEGELVVGAVFEPLVNLDEELRVVPGAAEAWEVLEDGRVFRFTLRDARFHDGTPVTAADFARTFHRIADGTAQPLSFLAFLLEPVAGLTTAQSEGGPIEGVVVEDEQTLRIELDVPFPGFLATLANPSLVPVPERADEDPESFAEQPIGNGPFTMVEPRERGAFIRLTSNPDHHRTPLVDEVLLSIYPDDVTGERQWQDLLDGQLHIANVPPDQLDEALEVFGPAADDYTSPGVIRGISSTVYLYGFDTSRPPYDNVDLRRAISLSIDRERIAGDVMRGTREPADSLVPPPIPGSQPGECAYCTHDPELARELFEDSQADIDSIVLTHNRGATHAAIAEAMAADIETVLELDVELQAMDLQPFVQAIRSGDAGMFRLGWDPTEPDPGSYLYPMFHSSQVGLENLTRYTDETVDALLDDARSSELVGTTLARYRQAEGLILEDMPVIPLLYYRHAIVAAPAVQELVWPPMGRVDLTTVWLDGS